MQETQPLDGGPLSLRKCAVCNHYETYHGEMGCSRDPQGNRSRDPGILPTAALKKTGALCWCPTFVANFADAVDLVHEQGTSAALKHCTTEAINRKDLPSARRLLDKFIIKTTPEQRDLDWMRAIERSIVQLHDETSQAALTGNLKSATEIVPISTTKGVVTGALLSRYRSEIKRAILAQLVLNPKATDGEICRCLDADGSVELPSSWKSKVSDRGFFDAYSDAVRRHKVEVNISKVRKDLRKLGLLE